MSNDIFLAELISIIASHADQIVNEVGEYEYLGFRDNKRLITDQYKDVLTGDAVWGWWILEKSSGNITASDEATRAASELARLNLGLLLEMLDASKNPSAMMLLSPSIHQQSDLPIGLAWLRSNCSQELAALALTRCLMVISRVMLGIARADGTNRPWSDDLHLIGDALACRPACEEVHLWWQVVANIQGIQAPGGSSGFANDVYAEASKRLSRHALDVFLPSPEALKRHQKWNPSVAAIIPYVVRAWPPERGTPALEAFYRDVERRFWGELYELPQAEKGVDALYIEAAGCAMFLEAKWGITPGWRATILSRLAGRSTCWDRDGTAASAERQAFVVAAACFEFLMTTDAVARKRVLDDLCSVVDAHLADWMWVMGYPCTIRESLPRLLTHVYALLPPLDGATCVINMAATIRDASVVEQIRQISGPILSDKENDALAKLVAELKAYENDLNPKAKGKN